MVCVTLTVTVPVTVTAEVESQVKDGVDVTLSPFVQHGSGDLPPESLSNRWCVLPPSVLQRGLHSGFILL